MRFRRLIVTYKLKRSKSILITFQVLEVQKVLSGSDHAGGLRLMGKYIGHRLVARPELDGQYLTD